MDLKFDIETFELVIKDGDFVLETNPSQQNAGIILIAKNFCSLFPTMGVGIYGVINSGISTIYEYLNRWNSQVLSDGAKSASWNVDKDNKINTNCDYIGNA
jgi:hypothetical protein